MIKSFLVRALRTSLSLALAGAAAKYGGDARYLAVQPFIAGAFKALRAKYPGKFDWIPL